MAKYPDTQRSTRDLSFTALRELHAARRFWALYFYTIASRERVRKLVRHIDGLQGFDRKTVFVRLRTGSGLIEWIHKYRHRDSPSNLALSGRS